MQVREITESTEQLDEFVITGSALLVFAGTAVISYLGATAIEEVVTQVKDWQDRLRIKNFEPKGAHIPDKTSIPLKSPGMVNSVRATYNAETQTWIEETKAKGGKWAPTQEVDSAKLAKYNKEMEQYRKSVDSSAKSKKLFPGVSLPTEKKPKMPTEKITKIVTVTANDIKRSFARKTITFGSKIAVLSTMQMMGAEKLGADPKDVKFKNQSNASGRWLQDSIDLEQKKATSSKWGKLAWSKAKSGASLIFNQKVFTAIGFIAPVLLIINAVRLNLWYKEKLNWPEPGFPVVEDNGNTHMYATADFNKDIRNLRTAFTNSAVAWMMFGGPQVIMHGLMWFIGRRPDRLLKDIKDGKIKGGFIKKVMNVTGRLLSKFVKPIKLAKMAAGAGLVYTMIDKSFAEKMVTRLADFMFNWNPTNKSSTIEDIIDWMMEPIDAQWDDVMGWAGIKTAGDINLDNAVKSSKDSTNVYTGPGSDNETPRSSNSLNLD